MPHYAYMLRCRDGSIYSGYTNDLDRRVLSHNSGRGARYTRSRLPVELAYYEAFENKHDAMRREYEYKTLTHAEKLELIAKGGAAN